MDYMITLSSRQIRSTFSLLSSSRTRAELKSAEFILEFANELMDMHRKEETRTWEYHRTDVHVDTANGTDVFKRAKAHTDSNNNLVIVFALGVPNRVINSNSWMAFEESHTEVHQPDTRYPDFKSTEEVSSVVAEVQQIEGDLTSENADRINDLIIGLRAL